MRIGLVIEQLDLHRGGAEMWTARFAEKLAAGGHEVHVVAKRFSSETLALPIVPHRLEGIRSRLGFAEAAQMKLLSLAPDAIHDMGAGWFCDVFHPHSGSMVALAERKLTMLPRWQRALKAWVDPLLPRRRCFQTLLQRQCRDDGRLIVALSKRVAADFERIHGVPRDRIRLIYNGVDTDQFSPRHRNIYREGIRRRLAIGNDTLLCLIVAHNFHLKGVPALLKAVRRLRKAKTPVRLVVVGGKSLAGWKRTARRLGVGDKVTFVGTVDNPLPYYMAADLYLHPTFYDACSLVVLEALGCGLPVVTSEMNGAGELMTEAHEGYLLPDPTDIDGLVGRIEMFFDAARRDRMGKAARRLALRYSLQRNVSEMLKVYDEVVRTRVRPAPTLLLGETRRQAGRKRCFTEAK